MRKPRSEMITETKAKLMLAARKAFGTVGYAVASMDDLTHQPGCPVVLSIIISAIKKAFYKRSSMKLTV